LKRKKTPKKERTFSKKLYEYIVPKKQKNVICHHIPRHAHHDQKEHETNNVIANHIVKHMYLMTKKERKKERKKKGKKKKESDDSMSHMLTGFLTDPFLSNIRTKRIIF
jgi:hypothetical protein